MNLIIEFYEVYKALPIPGQYIEHNNKQRRLYSIIDLNYNLVQGNWIKYNKQFRNII